MAERTELVSPSGVRVTVDHERAESYLSRGFTESTSKQETKQAPATRKRTTRKSTKTESE